MALLRQNIWTLFFILFTGSVALFSLIFYYEWIDINEKHRVEQASLVELVSSGMNSLFLTQEMMLDILGNELIKDESYQKIVKAPKILDDILELNPSIVSFGLATPEGKLTFVGGNLNTSILPNLKEQAVSRDSFIRTLSVDKMVLGRSYFYKPVEDWVIPIRKSIRDQEGTVLAVMTAGLRAKGTLKLFSDELVMGDFHTISLIRDQDRYIQFQTTTKKTLKEVYSSPLSDDRFEGSLRIAGNKYQHSLEFLKESEESYAIEMKDSNQDAIQIVFKYNKRFELWTCSHIKKSHIVSAFMSDMLMFILIFCLVQVIIYLLFRYIANVENQRRQELVFQATHDELTKLPNRSYLQRNIHKWIGEENSPFSLLFLDMDHFKNVNDSFGHEFGDFVLIELSKRLKSLVKGDDVVIRQGGDEFVILSSCTDDTELMAHADLIIEAVSLPYRVHDFSFILGASIGIAKFPQHGTSLDMLLRAADIAMYESKKRSYSVHIFADTMQKNYLNKVTIEQELRKALDTNSLYMVYQPQLDCDGVPYGVEALVRWEDENLGFVSPIDFIPIAEATGLMPRLGKFILHSSLSEMKLLQDTIGRALETSINISVRQFMDPTFLETLQNEVDKVGLERASITLEITENLLIEDIDYILPLLKQINAMDFKISMDDFGTGYSSLSMLRTLPIDELKIDKSFVDTILEDDTAKKMIQNIIAIGKNLGMSVLAEGVETQEQEAVLKSFGCDHFQGYYFARPMPYDKLLEFFKAK